MIVVDSSAAIQALAIDGEARQVLASDELHAPDLVDLEIANALRHKERRGDVTAREALDAFTFWRHVQIRRHSASTFLGRIWELRHNLTPYDAAYIALAEMLECQVLSFDRRLASAPPARGLVRIPAS